MRIHQFSHGFASKRIRHSFGPFSSFLLREQRTHILFATQQRSFFNDDGIDIFNYEYSRINRRGCWIPMSSSLVLHGQDSHTESSSTTLSLSQASRTSVLFSPCCRSNVDKERRNIRASMTAGPLSLVFPSRCALGVAAFRIRISFAFFFPRLARNPSFNPRCTRILLSGHGTRLDYIGNPHFHSRDKYCTNVYGYKISQHEYKY